MSSVFYDPQNHQMTIALNQLSDMAICEEKDGGVLVTIENIDDIEFYWPDERIWRPVDE